MEHEHLTNVRCLEQQPLASERLLPFAQSGNEYHPNLPGGLEAYKKLYKESIEDPATFYGNMATKYLHWFKPFDAVFHGVNSSEGGTLPSFGSNEGDNAWFLGGRLNACYNCVDRHAIRTPDKVALIYESDDGKTTKKTTFSELLSQVSRIAQILKSSCGVGVGDRVTVYMPMIPEAVVTLLAIARLGAIHSVVFAGFSANSLADRILSSSSKVVVTVDEFPRGGKIIQTKRIVDAALAIIQEKVNHRDKLAGQQYRNPVSKVLLFKRTGNPETPHFPGRDLDWDTEYAKYDNHRYPCEPVSSEHPLFLLYTSGSTGAPKGIQHSTAGYLLNAHLAMSYTFDTHPNDVFFTAGDIGWITGHTFAVYGPLSLGCTTVIFEGTPAYPDFSRYWRIVDRHKVTHFYAAPTALRLLKRAGSEYIENFRLTSLRCLGSVGEPVAPEVWEWFFEQIGKGEIPICDTYWQTESGSHLITPLAGQITPMKPGSASLPFFGINPVILDPVTGMENPDMHAEGVLAIKQPWPSIARTIWNDHNKYLETYFKPYPGYYFTGDSAVRDKDGYIWILGRVDDVVNVSGHRLSTAEIEGALIEHSMVAECAAVGFPDELTGQAVAVFVVLKRSIRDINVKEVEKELIMTVRSDIGPFAAPKLVILVQDLPKTRSGKIMRRILRKILAGETDQLGDTSTLSDPAVVPQLIQCFAKA